MRARRHLILLILAQTPCVALGLWIFQRFVVSELETTVAASALWAAGGMTFVWTSGLLGIVSFLLVSRMQEEQSRQKTRPEVDELRHVLTLVRTQESVIFGLAKLADSRDPETGDHLERISLYSSTLASALRRHEEFRETVTTAFVQFIGISSALHDIGKVGVEDAILRKPGPLSSGERNRMQDHTQIGEKCLKEIERRLGKSNFLAMAREIAAAHHERWDGTGYPIGIAGDDIPLAARIVSIADVYDALSSRRVYKDAMPHEECVQIIRDAAGTQFDPRLVRVFLEIESQFRDIARQFRERYEEDASFTVPETELLAITQSSELVPAGADHQ